MTRWRPSVREYSLAVILLLLLLLLLRNGTAARVFSFTLTSAAAATIFRILCVFLADVSLFRREISSFPKVQRVLKPTVMVIGCVTGANVSSHLAVCVLQIAN